MDSGLNALYCRYGFMSLRRVSKCLWYQWLLKVLRSFRSEPQVGQTIASGSSRRSYSRPLLKVLSYSGSIFDVVSYLIFVSWSDSIVSLSSCSELFWGVGIFGGFGGGTVTEDLKDIFGVLISSVSSSFITGFGMTGGGGSCLVAVNAYVKAACAYFCAFDGRPGPIRGFWVIIGTYVIVIACPCGTSGRTGGRSCFIGGAWGRGLYAFFLRRSGKNVRTRKIMSRQLLKLISVDFQVAWRWIPSRQLRYPMKAVIATHVFMPLIYITLFNCWRLENLIKKGLIGFTEYTKKMNHTRDLDEVEEDMKVVRKNILKFMHRKNRLNRSTKTIEKEDNFIPRITSQPHNPYTRPKPRHGHSMSYDATAVIQLPKLPFGKHKSYNDITCSLRRNNLIDPEEKVVENSELRNLNKKFCTAHKYIK